MLHLLRSGVAGRLQCHCRNASAAAAEVDQHGLASPLARPLDAPAAGAGIVVAVRLVDCSPRRLTYFERLELG